MNVLSDKRVKRFAGPTIGTETGVKATNEELPGGAIVTGIFYEATTAFEGTGGSADLRVGGTIVKTGAIITEIGANVKSRDMNASSKIGATGGAIDFNVTTAFTVGALGDVIIEYVV